MSIGDDDHGPDGFLSRWSRRKLTPSETQPDEMAPLEAEEPPLEADEVSAREELEPLSDAEILEKLNLPDPDEMKAGDDFSAFMNGAVPTRLRNRALRKLWLSNTALANLDELLDYGEDFTDAATVVENLQTAYQVGRGFLTDDDLAEKEAPEQDVATLDEEHAAAEHADEASKDDVEEQTAPQVDEAITAQEAPPPPLAKTPIPAPLAGENTGRTPEDVPLLRRSRRMVFDFQDQGENA